MVKKIDVIEINKRLATIVIAVFVMKFNLTFPPAGPSLPRLPTFRFFEPWQRLSRTPPRQFFSIHSLPLPRLPVVQLILFSLSIWIQMIDQNTNLHLHESKTMRKKHFSALFFSLPHGRTPNKSVTIPLSPFPRLKATLKFQIHFLITPEFTAPLPDSLPLHCVTTPRSHHSLS